MVSNLKDIMPRMYWTSNSTKLKLNDLSQYNCGKVSNLTYGHLNNRSERKFNKLMVRTSNLTSLWLLTLGVALSVVRARPGGARVCGAGLLGPVKTVATLVIGPGAQVCVEVTVTCTQHHHMSDSDLCMWIAFIWHNHQ